MNVDSTSLKTVLQKVEDTDSYDAPVSSVNSRNRFGDTPLHSTAVWGDIDSARILLASGADINAQGGFCGGDTPLHYAVGQGHFEFVKFLLENGASTTVLNDAGHTAKDVAVLGESAAIIALFTKPEKTTSDT